MNKQELIDILENLECSTESLSYDNGYEQGVYDSLSHVILLDEPKKVVVPRSVAEMIEIYKGKEISLAYLMRYFKGWHNKVNKGTMDSEALVWIVNNLEEFLDAWLHGYEVEKEPTIHELKILPEYFEAVVSGNKRFEIRKNDRNYKKGDILRLNEYQDGQYTGDVHVSEITYITDYAQQDDYVVLGIK
ncbi:DUF3850 domain-containing protein [Enterococcus faecalis]|uniref:DUF3850 domain-containing protein n=1 Tax=Enterococcus faecalis TaxID=1351 RepID=UPI002936CCB1|nr:DUF3850 domain-containing protein [Enterococcus faecalis]MDV2499610.1 DUF3850 domain-containing protein [Enterococcus faecalis]